MESFPQTIGILREGGSLQQTRLRELFQDVQLRGLKNQTELFDVVGVELNPFGDAEIRMTGDLVLRVFPAETVGECWRIFRCDEEGSNHWVWPEEEE